LRLSRNKKVHRTSQGIDGQFIHKNYQILKVSATTGIDDSLFEFFSKNWHQWFFDSEIFKRTGIDNYLKIQKTTQHC
jgi:hypothetical protein